jgi:hypothetical protein
MGVKKNWNGAGLPEVGTEVLIKLNSRKAPVPVKVTSREVKWSAEARAFRIDVNVVDAAGTPNQRALQDVYPLDWDGEFHTGLSGRFRYV